MLKIHNIFHRKKFVHVINITSAKFILIIILLYCSCDLKRKNLCVLLLLTTPRVLNVLNKYE